MCPVSAVTIFAPQKTNGVLPFVGAVGTQTPPQGQGPCIRCCVALSRESSGDAVNTDFDHRSASQDCNVAELSTDDKTGMGRFLRVSFRGLGTFHTLMERKENASPGVSGTLLLSHSSGLVADRIIASIIPF